MFCHPFMRLLFICIDVYIFFSFILFFISSVIDTDVVHVNCLYVSVTNTEAYATQWSLSAFCFGYVCYISFLFFN